MGNEAIVMVEAVELPDAEIYLADPATEAAALQGAALDAAAILLDHLVIPGPAGGPEGVEADVLDEQALPEAVVAEFEVAAATAAETSPSIDSAVADALNYIQEFGAENHDGPMQDGLGESLVPLARSDTLEDIGNGGQTDFALSDEGGALGAGSPVWSAEGESFVSSMRATYDAVTSENSTGAYDEGSGASLFDLMPVGSLLAFAQGQIAAFGLDPTPYSASSLPDADALLAIAATDLTELGLDAQMEALNTVAAIFSGAGQGDEVVTGAEPTAESQPTDIIGYGSVLDGGGAIDALFAQAPDTEIQQAPASAVEFAQHDFQSLMDSIAAIDPSLFG